MKRFKQFLSLLLALSIVFGLALPAAATDTDAHVHSAATAEDSSKELDVAVSMDKDALEDVTIEFDFDYTNVLLMSEEEVEVDTENPAIIAFETELDSIQVLNADGESVALTEEEKQTILHLYQQYLGNWAANADLLGVQTPFFLSYNDNNDELGILGEMLVLANIPLEAVRAGQVSYDDITGMIQNFLYADALGVAFYGDIIRNARNEVLNLVAASGAQTDVQKYLVINNWLAQNVTFDMPYIMNSDKEPGEEPMVAPNPQKHEYYDYVYQAIYGDYEEQIRATFEQKIRDGLEAEFKKQYYNGAIEQGYYQGVYAEVEAQLKDAMYQQVYEAAYKTAYQAAYDEYIEKNAHVHDYVATITTAVTCGAAGVKTFTCSDCGDSYTEEIPASGEHNYVDGKCDCGAEEVVPCEHEYSQENTDGACIRCGAVHEDHVDENTDNNCDICYIEMPSNGEIELPDDELSGDTVYADGVDEELAAAADAYAKAQAEAVATEEANAAVAAQAEATAKEETDKFMTENAEAIAADPVAFVEGAFGADAAAQIAAGWEAFWADAQENGVEVDPVNAPGYLMTVDQIVTQQMDTPQQDPMLTKLDENGNPVLDADGNVTYMTPNEAIPVFADQAAVGLTEGVLDYWQGSHFGALGRGTAVCLGYTKAFAYLVQCLHADIYTTDGDIDNPASWRTAEDLYYTNGELDTTKDYIVDCVRITFDTDVTMYGETQENFNSDHFWNAVKVDGKWYYVDPCYVDVYTEVMNRDRVETDGSVNYMYFMFSHTTTTSLYEGYYSMIKTLYENSATHTDYEDSWLSRVKSNLYFDGGYAYYLYDSTDLISQLDMSNNMQDTENLSMDDSTYKVVRHQLTTTDAGSNGDTDYETLIEFNYKANEDDDETVARVKDASGNMVESELLTKLYAQHEDDKAKYPSLALSAVFYDNKVYFNLSNVILSYDINTCEVVVVKVYDTVSASRDKTNAFGGMAFSVVSNGGDFTVQNHPITGLSLKDDGKLYVSIATNFAFISGKDPHNSADQGSYGYEFEESNYNQNYNSYINDMMGEYEGMGYEMETNDNDEFMWSANFVAVESMTNIAASQYTGDVFAAREHEHHFIRFEETYYTKDDNGNWNTGFCYICPECLFSIEEPSEPDPDADYASSGTTYEEQLAIYEEEKAIYDAAAASAGHNYAPSDVTWAADNSTVTFSKLECESVCSERKNVLDCLMNDNTISMALETEVTADAVKTTSGVCAEGLVETYTASGEIEVDGSVLPYEFSKEVTLEPTACKFVDNVCSECGAAHEHSYEAVVTAPTCTEDGYTTYTCDCGDTYTDDAVEAPGHNYENGVCVNCSEADPDFEAPHEHTYEAVVTAPTCTEDGYTTYTCDCGDTYTDDAVEAPGHNYENGTCTVCGDPDDSIVEETELQIIQQPVDYVGVINEKASFTVVAAGEGLTYQWEFSKNEGESWTNASSTTDTYTVAINDYRLTYLYRCVITDANGNSITTDVVKMILKTEEPEEPEVSLEITQQPVDYVGVIGDTASFTVVATGEGLTYQWEFSNDAGTTWAKASSTTEIYTAAINDYRLTYLYRCVITDANGNSITTDVVKMMLPESEDLVIVSQPVSYEGSVNDTVIFTVEATGSDVTYEWFYSNDGGETWTKSYVTGYNTNVLEVVLYSYRDGNMYKCVVSDAQGNSIETDPVSMTIKAEKIEITKQPTDVSFVQGETAYFTVEATGSNLTYRWQYSSDGGETWQNTWLEGYNTNTLTVAMNSNRRGNLYRCAITGANETIFSEAASLGASQSVTLEITEQPVNAAVAIGQKASFTVKAQGDDLKYQWYASSDDGNSWSKTYLDGATTDTLSFDVTAGRAAKVYKCIITDANKKTVESNVVKIVSTELAILSQPTDVACNTGEQATFTVEAQGDGLTYQWYRSNDDGVTWSKTYLDGFNTQTLSFAANAGRAAYIYKCVITDAAGNTVESNVVKIVSTELAILSQPTDVACNTGEQATFTVEAQGDGLTYQWYRSNDDGKSWSKTYLDGFNTETLSFAANAGRAAYIYKCVITDAAGNTVETNPVSITMA